MSRWIFTDPVTSDEWTMPINPDSMTPVPLVSRKFRNGPGAPNDPRPRTFLGAPDPVYLEWAGVIRTQEHYDALVEWSEKTNEVYLVDHLERTFTIFITAFTPEDRKPTPNTPWRLRYSMRAVLLDHSGSPTLRPPGTFEDLDQVISGTFMGLSGGISGGPPWAGDAERPYRTFTFTAAATQTYLIQQLTYTGTDDTYMIIYDGPFNPAAVDDNVLAYNDDRPEDTLPATSIDLVAGQTVTVLITPYDYAGDPFDLPFTIDAGGPGTYGV